MQKTILNIQFKTSLCKDELIRVCEEDKKLMSKAKGLFIKYYHINDEKNLVGSTYIFNKEDNARDYLSSFMMDGIGVRYGIIPESLQVNFGSVIMEVCGDGLFTLDN